MSPLWQLLQSDLLTIIVVMHVKKVFTKVAYTLVDGDSLKREEAMLVLKEIFDKCTLYDGSWVALMPPNSANVLAHGYQLHLKVPLDEQSRSCMQDVLQKYDLAMMFKENEGLTVIYKPKTGEKGVI